MWRMYQHLRWVWLGLIVGLVVLPLAGDCVRGFILGTGCKPWKPALAFVDTYYPWIVLFLFLLGGLTWFARQNYRRNQLSKYFDLLKPSSKLIPEDLGFQVVKPEEEAELEEQSDLYRHPFYESVYVSRLAVPYDHRANENPEPYYDEDDLADYLRENKGLLLIGPPADGKTRTLYEILKRMDGYELLKPKIVNEKGPERADLSLVLRGKRVVLLLDGLESYLGRKSALLELGRSLDGCKSPWVVASTCQDEPELTTVEQDLGSFYDGLHLRRLSLIPPTPQQKAELAEGIGKDDWDPEKSHEYPTLGSIAMEGALTTMRRRFDILLRDHREQANALRALKRLGHAGVQPYTEDRLRAVLGCERLFPRNSYHLQEILESLASQAFLRFGNRRQIQPESAYLRDAVTYSPVKSPEEDFPELADVLGNVGDTDGLFSLGITYAHDLEDYEEARKCFDRAVHLSSGDAQVWFSKADSLLKVGGYLQRRHAPIEEATDTFEKALGAYEQAVDIEPNFPEAWYGKGLAIGMLHRPEEALEAFDKAIERKADFHDAWCAKGLTLVYGMKRPQEALDVLDKAIRLDPSCPRAWMYKGRALFDLGLLQGVSPRLRHPTNPYEAASARRSQEASAVFDKAVEALDRVTTSLDPDSSRAWVDKAEVLLHSGRDWKAAEAIDKAVSLRPPDDPDLWERIGGLLRSLKRHPEALEAFDRAIDLNPGYYGYWVNRGILLRRLGRPWVEIDEAFTKAIGLDPNKPELWYYIAATLANLGRHQEAIDTYDKAISLKPDFTEAWFNRGLALNDLGHYPQALEAFDKAARLSSDDPRPWEMKGQVLEKLSQYPEAKEARDKAANLRRYES